MNKFAYICGVAALALGFTACDDELPNPPGQSNPQPEIFDSSSLVISQDGAGETTALNLQADADQGLKTVLGKVTSIANFPEGYELVFDYEFSNTADFEKTVNLEFPVEDDLIVASPSAINTAIFDTFTHDPSEITLHARIAAYAKNAGGSMRLGGTDKIYGEYTYKFIPFTPVKGLENSYYLLTRAVGAATWSIDNATAMTHTSAESVYDNPVFQIKVDVDADGIEWAVLPGSSFDAAVFDGLLGVEDAEAMEGALVADGAAGVITEASPYTIKVDVLNDTYAVAYAYEYLWVPTGGSSLSNFSRMLKLSTTDFINYTGTIRLNNDWFLTGQQALSGFVLNKKDDPVVNETTGVETGTLVNSTEAPHMTSTNGLYYLEVNLGTFSYKKSPVQTISAIGEYNGWDLETALDLTRSTNFLTWELKGVELPAGEIKFCVNHSWTLSYGGSFDNLIQNGGNLVIEAAGKYDIKIDFSKLPNTVTFTKK